MKWIKLIVTLLEIIIPGLALKGKANLGQELDVAKKAIEQLSKNLTPSEKARVLEDAVNSLRSVKNFKVRACKKIEKAGFRLFKKVF